MATGLQVEDAVYVPRERVGLEEDQSAVYRTSVVEVNDRSVQVKLPGGEISDWIGASLLHRMVGVQLFRVGDFETEDTLLNPLLKSLLQFCRLLLPDDMVFSHRVRGLKEFRHYWKKKHSVTSHVIVVGHGSDAGIRFGVDGWIEADSLADIGNVDNVRPKVFVSMCCSHGYKSFAGVLSERADVFRAVIAPFHSVHGAMASQFCQTYLAYQFLRGYTTKVAFRKARESVPGAVSFRLWERGNLTAGAT